VASGSDLGKRTACSRCLLWAEQAGAFMPEGLHVLTLRGGEIEELMAFRSPEVFPSFDLPASIAA